MPLHYRHAKKIATRIVDGEAFVISETQIKHLNQVATIIWLSLTKPTTERELVEILLNIYPMQTTATLRRDVRQILRQLVKEEIVLRT